MIWHLLVFSTVKHPSHIIMLIVFRIFPVTITVLVQTPQIEKDEHEGNLYVFIEMHGLLDRLAAITYY